MRRGDICWASLPDEEKQRPVLVLTRDEAIPAMGRVVIAYLTTKIRGIPIEVRLGAEDGVPRECVVNFDNLRTVSCSLLSEPITTLSGPRMHEACRALAIATGCD
ncbi:MAG TPA: type II toxin-antitoxin system PemK/MazF family toxin [Solirubrobacterales bacterium]|nr:type II toxin-antitoxin system PemK/MazF family toxin [Solirubrobacterales bacterium]